MNGISIHITVSSIDELKRVLNQLEPIQTAEISAEPNQAAHIDQNVVAEATPPVPTQAYHPVPKQDEPILNSEIQYTFDQLSQAAALFAKSSPQNRDAAMALLEKYDVKSLADLQQEQYAAFAAELKKLGAKI